MYQIIIVVHVVLGLGIIGLVLMQQGKGADAGAAFGSGSSGSVFGAQGSASFLSRTTAIFATLFFTTSLTLAVLSGKQSKTVDIMEAVETSTASDVPVAAKPKAPAVSAVTDTPAAVPALDVPAVVTPAAEAAANAVPVVDSVAKVSENKPAAEKPVDAKTKTADKDKKSDKKANKSEKAKDKPAESTAKKPASDKKEKTSDKH